MRIARLAAALAIGVAAADIARAVTITNVRALGDAGGVWDNSNAANWRIWFTRDPLSNPAPTFVNIPALNTPFALAFGDNLFAMYKENYLTPNHDGGTTFSFSNGSATGSLTVTMSPTDYLSTTTIPGAAASISLAGTPFSITSYGWMRNDVLNRDRVSSGSPTPSGTNDHIGVVNIRVGPVSVPTGGTGPGGLERADMTSSLLYWMRADTGVVQSGGAVSAWNDQTSRANNFSQGTLANQPLLVAGALGGNALPAVRFDGSNDSLLLATAAAAQTVFIVNTTSTGQGTLPGIWGSDNPSDKGIRRLDATQWAHPSNTDDWTNPAGSAMYVNGVATNLVADGTPHILSAVRSTALTFNRTLLGGYYPARNWKGDMGEVVAYDRVLNLAERQIVENALSAKYSIPLTAGDVYAGDNPANGNYDLDIFGVGRVNLSNYVPAAGAAGLGIAPSLGTLDDGDWLLAGHRVLENSAEGGLWQRAWFLDKTGSLDATLTFDFSDAGLTPPPNLFEVAPLLYYSATGDLAYLPLALPGTVDGDRISFFVPDALLQDGYYTLMAGIPEPATLALLGLGALGLLRRRRK